MSYRFYRYEGNEKVYQCACVDIKDYKEAKYRMPFLGDAESKKDATIFPIDDLNLLNFLEYWFELCAEEVEEDD